jgi:hypothetical protein
VALHVDSTNEGMRLSASSGDLWATVQNGTATSSYGVTTGNRGFFGTISNHELDIRTNNGTKLSIKTSGEVYLGGDTDTYWHYPSADTQVWTTAGSERLRIDSSGNVGVGTASPSFPLSVVGKAHFDGKVGMGSNPSDNHILQAVSNVNDPTSFFVGTNFGLNLVLTSTNAQQIIGGEFSAGYGSGSSSHTGQLVGGRFIAQLGATGTSSNSYAGEFYVYNTSTGTVTNAYAGQFRMQNLNASGTITNAYGIYIGGGFNNGTITNYWGLYQTEGDQNYFASDIGIGDTTPDARLDIVVDSASKEGLVVQGASSQTADLFRVIDSGSSDLVVVDSSGNMGINEASPDALLEVSGDSDVGQQIVTLDQNDADQPFIDFQGSTGADTTSSISTNTTSGSTTHHIQIEINGTKAWIAASTNNPS